MPRVSTSSRSTILMRRRPRSTSTSTVDHVDLGALDLDTVDGQGSVDLVGIDLGHVVGLDRRGRTRRHLLAELAAVAAVATATLALGDLANAVGQQRHLPGEADRLGDLALLLGGVAGDPAGPDLGPLRHEPPQQVDVLVVDPLDLLGVEDRDLLLLRPTPVGRGALAVASPFARSLYPLASSLAIRTAPRRSRRRCSRLRPPARAAAAATSAAGATASHHRHRHRHRSRRHRGARCG